MYITISIDC